VPSRTDSKQTGAELIKIYSVPNPVSDPDSVNTDPDSLNADPDPDILLDPDPDPGILQNPDPDPGCC
jgi:hypothetical protein